MKAYMILGLMLLFTLFCSCKREVNLEIEKENVKLVLEQWLEAFEAEDIELFSKLIFNDEEIVTFGTDAAERWVGLEEIKQSVQKQFDSFDETKWDVNNQVIVVNKHGQTAWFSQLIDLNVIIKDDTMDFKGMRMTGVLDKVNDSWKLVQFHGSIGVEGQAMEY